MIRNSPLAEVAGFRMLEQTCLLLILSLLAGSVAIGGATSDCYNCTNCQGSTEDSPYECCYQAEDSSCFANGVRVCEWTNRPDGLPICLCNEGYGGLFCTFGCNCSVPHTLCDFEMSCTCEGKVCAHGVVMGCNATDGLSAHLTCSCDDGWDGEMCDKCLHSRFGPRCEQCPSCPGQASCDEGVEGTGKCLCFDCRRTLSGTLGMFGLSGLMCCASLLTLRTYLRASPLPEQAQIRPLFLLFVAVMLSRAIILACNAAVNTQSDFDTIMQVVMDIPGLIMLAMYVFLLANVFDAIERRKRQDPLSFIQRMTAEAPATSLLPRVAPSSFSLPDHRIVSRVQDLLFASIFIVLLLLMVCVPVLLDSSNETLFITIRYSVWIGLYALLSVMFMIGMLAVRPSPHHSPPHSVWCRARLVSVSRICLIASLLRMGFLIVGCVLGLKDLVRPSLDLQDTLFQVIYYLSVDLVPLCLLLRQLTLSPLSYDEYVKGEETCFISPDLISLGAALNSGSSGTVYRAKLLDVDVACKEQSVQDLNTLQEVVHEAMLLRKLTTPFVVRFYGIALSHPRCYLVTELCDESLEDILNEHRLHTIDTRAVILDVCDGMAYIHAKNFIHRDLKPSNVLLANGRAKICDLGTATFLRHTHLTSRLGTPIYMAPEMLANNELTSYTHRVDVFSFAILLWSLVARAHPYEDVHTSNSWDLVRRVERGLRPPRFESSMPPPLWDLMARCWHKDPSQRPDFVEIGITLREIFANHPTLLEGEDEGGEMSGGEDKGEIDAEKEEEGGEIEGGEGEVTMQTTGDILTMMGDEGSSMDSVEKTEVGRGEEAESVVIGGSGEPGISQLPHSVEEENVAEDVLQDEKEGGQEEEEGRCLVS